MRPPIAQPEHAAAPQSRLAAAEQLLSGRRALPDSLNEALGKGRVAAAAALLGSGVDLEYRNSLGTTLVEAAFEGGVSRSIEFVRGVLQVGTVYSIQQGLSDDKLLAIAKDAARKLPQSRGWSVGVAVEGTNVSEPGRITLPMRLVLWEMIPRIEADMRARQREAPTWQPI